MILLKAFRGYLLRCYFQQVGRTEQGAELEDLGALLGLDMFLGLGFRGFDEVGSKICGVPGEPFGPLGPILALKRAPGDSPGVLWDWAKAPRGGLGPRGVGLRWHGVFNSPPGVVSPRPWGMGGPPQKSLLEDPRGLLRGSTFLGAKIGAPPERPRGFF